MQFTLESLAASLGVELRGDGDVPVVSVGTLQNAGQGDLSFLANPKYRKYLPTTGACAVILTEEYAAASPVPVLITENPYLCYARAARLLYREPAPKAGVHPSALVNSAARVHRSARVEAHCVIKAGADIGARVHLGPGCVIGNDVSIGEDSKLVARVTVLAAARIGRRVILHPGVVVGSDGFGLAQAGDHWEKVPQLGGVRVGDDVEIGANTTIDRGAIEDTVIEDGVKIDNQVQVAHNVFIGAHTAIAGCVGISGSARIGSYCTLAGGVGIVGHLEITDHVHITGMSLVTKSIPEAGTYSSGTAMLKNQDWRRMVVRMKQLDMLAQRVNELEKSNKKK